MLKFGFFPSQVCINHAKMQKKRNAIVRSTQFITPHTYYSPSIINLDFGLPHYSPCILLADQGSVNESSLGMSLARRALAPEGESDSFVIIGEGADSFRIIGEGGAGTLGHGLGRWARGRPLTESCRRGERSASRIFAIEGEAKQEMVGGRDAGEELGFASSSWRMARR